MGDETKSLIRSCLISTKGGLSLRELKRDFHTLVGYPIPFRDAGHRSLEDYLRSIPDVVRLDDRGPEPMVHFVVDASTAGIASLVQRQKGAKKKAPPPRRPTGYVPRPGYGTNRHGGFSAPRFDFQPRRTFNVRPTSGGGMLPTPRPRWSQPAAVRPPAPSYHKPQQQQSWSTPPTQTWPGVPTPPTQTWPGVPTQPAKLPPQQQQQQQQQQQYKPAPAAESQSRGWSEPAKAPTPTPAPAPTPAPTPSAPVRTVTAPAPTPAPTPAPAPAASQSSGPQTPKQELQAFIREHGLPEAKLETVSFRPKSKSAVASFYSTITVGDVRCQTYPSESPSSELAESAACQLALDELKQRRQRDTSKRESPVTSNQHVVATRVAQMLESRRYGLWRDSVPDEYRRLFNERVPEDWEDLLYQSGTVRFDCVGADRFILYSATHVSGPAGDPGSPVPPPTPPAGCLMRLETVQLPDEEMFPVWVTCVLSGSQLAFRLIGEQHTDRLDDLMTEMELSLTEEEQRNVAPVIGGIYLAQVDGTAHRVQVQDILDDMVSAFFVDMGVTELVSARSLRPLDAARFGQLPGQALHASLSGVDGERPGAADALSRLVLRKSLICQVVVAEDSRLEVVLFDTSGEDDVNINQTLQAMAEVEAPPQLPPVGGIVDAFVVHVARPGGELYVQLDSSAADEVCQRVAAAGEHAAADPPPAAVPPAGRLLLARYSDGGWYRARPLASATKNGRLPVLFVDYGNEESVPVSELRPLPAALERHPPQAVAVRLTGVQMSDAAALRLTEMVPDGSTRVVLRVTARPDGSAPEVDAYKRLDNNELVSINATLQVEAHMSGRPATSRQSSVTSAPSRPESVVPPASVRSPSPTEQLLRLQLSEPQHQPQQRPASQAQHHQQARPASRQHSQTHQPATPTDPNQPIRQYLVPRDTDGFLDVTVSCCSSPWNIYVQPYLESAKLNQLMAQMQQFYGEPSNLRPLAPGDVTSGQFCAVKNPEDDTWYRARVETRLDSGEVTIKFVDYGDFSYVPVSASCVQPLSASFRALPGQAVKARLGGVQPAGSDWTIDDCIALQRLLSADGASGGTFVAELLDFSRDAITGEQLVIVRLVDTSGETDLYVDRALVQAGNAVHSGQYYRA